jgi:hypothetical protein
VSSGKVFAWRIQSEPVAKYSSSKGKYRERAPAPAFPVPGVLLPVMGNVLPVETWLELHGNKLHRDSTPYSEIRR